MADDAFQTGQAAQRLFLLVYDFPFYLFRRRAAPGGAQIDLRLRNTCLLYTSDAADDLL